MSLPLTLVLVVLFVTFSYGYEEKVARDGTASKKTMVAEIIKKVSKLTENYLSKARGRGKASMLNKIEKRLKNTARAMGIDGDKYVELIIKGIKLKSNDKVKPILKRDDLGTNNKTLGRTGLKAKKEMIPMVAKKLQLMSRAYLQNATSYTDKLNALEEIKTKFIESAQKKHKEIHDMHADIKNYNDLVAKGLEMMKQRIIMDDLNRRNNAELDDEVIVKHKHNSLMDSNHYNSIEDIDNTLDLCNSIIDETCFVIQSLNRLTCSNGNNVPIEKLCDGVPDCSDGSDEVDCVAKVMEKLQKANNLISEVETSLSHKCIKQDVADKIISPHNQVLRNVLQTQIDFLEKYPNTNSSVNAKSEAAVDNVFLKILNDVALVLGTLAMAFQGTLCVPDSRIAVEDFTEALDGIDDGVAEIWSPKSCTCKGQYCSSSDCATPCNRVCWQKYSLDHWGCQASNGGNSISLDEICDGKLDCFDETDENRCASGSSFARFESLEIYKEVIALILEKTKLKEYESSRNIFLTLLEFVKQLQKATVSTHNDPQAIKLLRGQAFLSLVKIYEDILQTATLQELDKAYISLLAINEQLVEAMKRSNTGNDVLLSSDQCFCRDGHCALRSCSKNCIRACIAEPRLTRYTCSGGSTIALDAICNNINDCPNADDEKGCNKQICRPHHLMVLRHNLRDVGENKKGTALGEQLMAWRIKVTATLLIAENNQRTTFKNIGVVITSMLRDLVQACSTLEDKGPSTDYIIKEFEKTAKVVMKALKSCGK